MNVADITAMVTGIVSVIGAVSAAAVAIISARRARSSASDAIAAHNRVFHQKVFGQEDKS